MNRTMELSTKYQLLYDVVTFFSPIIPFDTSENIRNPLVFWCFQGNQFRRIKREHGKKRINSRDLFTSLSNIYHGAFWQGSKQHPNSCYLNIILFLHSPYHSKITGDVLKKCTKSKRVNFNDVVWLIITRLKIKNRSQIYVINRPRPRHGHKCTKYKMYLSITMVICIKQHLSNIWSSIHESWATLRPSWQKSVAYKKRVYSTFMYVFIMSYARLERIYTLQ